MPAQVFVPRDLDAATRHPVLYLFHGRYGSERGWMGGSFGRQGVGSRFWRMPRRWLAPMERVVSNGSRSGSYALAVNATEGER